MLTIFILFSIIIDKGNIYMDSNYSHISSHIQTFPSEIEQHPQKVQDDSATGAIDVGGGKKAVRLLKGAPGLLKSVGKVAINTLLQKVTVGKSSKMFGAKAAHASADLGNISAQILFGSKVVDASRNVANKEVLRNGEDIKASHALVQTLQTLKHSGSDLQVQGDDEEFENTISDGICAGISLNIATRHLLGTRSEEGVETESIEEIIASNREGASADAAANQAIYQMLTASIDAKTHINMLMSSLKKSSEGIKNSSTEKEVDSLFYQADFSSIDRCRYNLVRQFTPGQSYSGEGLGKHVHAFMQNEYQKLQRGEAACIKNSGGKFVITDYSQFKEGVKALVKQEANLPLSSIQEVEKQTLDRKKEGAELEWLIGILQYEDVLLAHSTGSASFSESDHSSAAKGLSGQIGELKKKVLSLFGRGRSSQIDFSHISNSKIGDAISFLHNKRNNYIPYNAVARARGLELKSVESIMGQSCMYRDNKSFLQNITQLDAGVYALNFATIAGGHAITYVKQGDGKGYILDPNGFQIRHDSPEEGRDQLLTLINGYPGPGTIDESHKKQKYNAIAISKFEKSVG